MKNIKLAVLSEEQAIFLSRKIKKDFCIISITNTFDRNIKFSNNPHLLKVLNLKFNDLESNDTKNNIKAPTLEDFKNLKNFVDSIDNCILIIHCFAGESRSAGLAAAINEYLNLGYDILDDKDFRINKRVYKLAKNVLHK